MSWDADLYVTVDGNDINVFDTNFTHNTNCMANHALGLPVAENTFEEVFGGGETWWKRFDGKSAVEGSEFLSRIIDTMESDPNTYQAMNPENGWGSYDSFLDRLIKMKRISDKYPSGHWKVSG